MDMVPKPIVFEPGTAVEAVSKALCLDLKKVMAFWKEQLRADHQWINHSWVPPIKDHNNRDRISELPDSILLHILNFMNTKSAVQTCVLSKRWKDLCKRLISLAYCPDPYLLKKRGVGRFMKFATWVLSRRDDAYSLLNLTLHLCWTEPELLDKVTKYALLHDVRQLTMELYSGFRPDLESLPLIFCCHSLTSLKLCINGMNYPLIILPKSLHLPALKSLHLQGFNFTATGNDSAEPFSNCYVLNTLVLRFCSLHNDARVLCISNSTLSILTILEGQTYQIVLSTPNLSSFTIRGSSSLQLFSTCNLSFLGEVNIDVSWDGHWAEKSSIISSNIVRWLVVLAYVKKLSFSRYAFQIILHDFSNPISMRPEPPSFVRLESLKVIKLLSANVSDEKVNTVVEYLLRDSPMARVEILGEY
ncbi:hypothetical protein JHK85_025579 [Glycine max]|nr:hypothetical protein JHK85_025579 [Glycine max]